MSAATPLSPLERIRPRFEGEKRKSTGGYMVLCPAHADRNPSLSIDESDSGDLLVRCFAGCDTEDVLRAWGLQMSDLHADSIRPPEPIQFTGKRRLMKTYEYLDTDGNFVFGVDRMEPKGFRQWHLNAKGEKVYNLQGVKVIPYKADKLAAANGRWINDMEGEKDADGAEELGLIATTLPMGANRKLTEDDAAFFGNSPVAVWVDNDNPGCARALQHANVLHAAGHRVKIIHIPDVPEHGDFSDWIAAGHTKEDAIRLVRETLDFKPGAEGEAPRPDPDTTTMAVSKWPTHIIPTSFRDYIEAQAIAIGVPPEMIALHFMSMFAAFIGNRLAFRLKSGFLQYGAFWIGVVAPPGAAKSPSFAAARWPFQKIQADLYAVWKAQMVEYEKDVERWKTKSPEERGPKPIEPELRHIYSTDATIEAITRILQGTPGLSIVLDELISFINSMDKYRSGKGSDRQAYLSMWSFTDTKVDRRGGPPVYLPSPNISVMGGIQPDMLAEIQNGSSKRDGLIERFVLVRPDVAPAGWTDDEVDLRILDRVVEELRSLDRSLPPRDFEANESGAYQVQMTPDARRVWAQWYDENASLVAESNGLRQGFVSKLPLQVARFALILSVMHNLDDPRRMISADRMCDAIELGEFCRAHLDRVLPLIGEVSIGRAGGVKLRVLRILENEGANQEDGWVSRRTLFKGLGNVKADDLTAALEQLLEEGTAERRTESTATKPREDWRVKPKTGESTNSSNCSTDDESEVF